MTTATKEKSKEKEVNEVKETKSEIKETKPKKEDFKIRHLTDEEQASLVEDKEPVEGYVNRPLEVSDEEEEEAEEKKPEEKKEEKKAEKVEQPKEEKKDFFERMETELVKPEGKEDLGDFTPREKAYFYQMRRDRKLRQQAETERDQAIFRETKLKEKKEEKPKEEEDPLKGKDDEDFITAKEARELLKKQKENQVEDNTEKQDEEFRQHQFNYLRMCENEAKKDRPDFDAVMELADDLIVKDSTALNEVSTRTKKGENPAIVMYEIIKKNREFETLYPAAELRAKAKKQAAEKSNNSGTTSSPAPTPEDKAKEEKAKQAEKALEDNNNRPKTTAHVSSQESKPADELTMEEIAKMSDLEFAKLSPAVRKRYLKKYGA